MPGTARSLVSLACRRSDANSATTPQSIAARKMSPGMVRSGTAK